MQNWAVSLSASNKTPQMKGAERVDRVGGLTFWTLSLSLWHARFRFNPLGLHPWTGTNRVVLVFGGYLSGVSSCTPHLALALLLRSADAAAAAATVRDQFELTAQACGVSSTETCLPALWVIR